MTHSGVQEMTPVIGVLFFLVIIFFAILLNVVLIVVPFWQIFKKAGFSGALSLIMLVPFGNIIMPFILAFSEWPALKDKKQAPPYQPSDPQQGDNFVI